MSSLRDCVFNLVFYLSSAVIAVACLPLLAGPPRWAARVGAVWGRIELGLARAIVGLGYTVEGRPHLARRDVVFAAKHQSVFDALALPALIDDPAIVVKRELLWIPLFGWYLARAGMIAVDRKGGAAALRALVAQARRARAAGRPILIFPEGTRTPPGAPVGLQPGIAALYDALAAEIVPINLDSGRYWPRRSFMRRAGRVRIIAGPPIPAGLARRDFLDRLGAALAEPANAPPASAW